MEKADHEALPRSFQQFLQAEDILYKKTCSLNNSIKRKTPWPKMKSSLVLVQKLFLVYNNLILEVQDTLANYGNRDDRYHEEGDALEALDELCAEAEFQDKSLNILEAIRRVS